MSAKPGLCPSLQPFSPPLAHTGSPGELTLPISILIDLVVLNHPECSDSSYA